MQYRKSTKAAFYLPLALLCASVVSPAHANWFHIPSTNFVRNVGSAPSPKPEDIRAYRLAESAYPAESQLMNEQGEVKLKVSLTKQGTVSAAVVESSSGFPRLDVAAVQYMKANMAYKQPAGDEMPATVAAVVTFKLQ